MKKILLLVGALGLFLNVYAQNTGIGTTNPTNTLHVVSPNAGIEPLRVQGMQNGFYNDTTFLIQDNTGLDNGMIRTMSLTRLRSLISTGTPGGGGQDIDAGDGLIYDNSTNPITMHILANNGLSVSSLEDRVQLGGPLTKTTLISHGPFSLNYDLTGTGDFTIRDNGLIQFGVFDNGNVGIGGTNTPAKLSVTGNSNFSDDLTLKFGTVNGIDLVRIYDVSDDGVIDVSRGGIVVNKINGSGNSFFNAGNFGIGTSAPQQKLHVVGRTRISTLSGPGIRMVTADANGDLATQVIPNVAIDTDDQQVMDFSLAGNILTLQLQDDLSGAHSVNLSGLGGSGGIQGVDAGLGLIGGGSAGTPIIHASVDNGLSIDASEDKIRLGGQLLKHTSINQGGYSMIYNIQNSGNFEIRNNVSTFFFARNNGRIGIGTTAPAHQLHATGNMRIDGRQLYFGAVQRLIGDNGTNLDFRSNHSNFVEFALNDKENTRYGAFHGEFDGSKIGITDGDGNWSIEITKDEQTSYMINGIEKYRMTPRALEFINFSDNVSIGISALNTNGSGHSNVAVGRSAMNKNTTGYWNVGVGREALFNNTTGYYNLGVGVYALGANTTGNGNVGVGSVNALTANTSGDWNTAFGTGSLSDNTTGNFNVGLGYNAGDETTTTSDNTSVGAFAGRQLRGTANTSIGTNSGYTVGTTIVNYSYSTALGGYTNVTASDQARIGTVFTNSIGGYRAWSNLSDGRFKSNILENVPGLDFILELRPVTYQLNTDELNQYFGYSEIFKEKPEVLQKIANRGKGLETGFIAQEVERSAQNLGYSFNGVDAPQNENDHYSLRYSMFTVPLVKAVQEQQEIITTQEKEITTLKSENEDIKARLAKLEALMLGNQ